MGKLRVLDATAESEYTDVTLEELDLKETMEHLFAGDIVLMSTYDNDKDKNILVRFKETANGIITQISRPDTAMEGFLGTQKYWSLHEVGINTLSMYPTYVYDPSRYNLGYKFAANTIVEFTTDKGELDVAIIKKIYQDSEGNFYYSLSGEGARMFAEEELTFLEGGG